MRSIVSSLVEILVKSLVRNHDDVTVRETDGGRFVRVKVNRADMGLLIGTGGRNSLALQYLLASVTDPPRQPCRLVIEEPTVGERTPPKPFIGQSDWDSDRIKNIVMFVGELIADGDVRVTIHDSPDSFTTTVTIVFGRSVPPATVNHITKPLQTLIESAGKLAGRIISVSVVLAIPAMTATR